MTPEEHQHVHIRLHTALDELLACFIAQGNGSIKLPIVDLLMWAYRKALAPTPADAPDHAHALDKQRAAFEYSGERQMIMLALAELLLSRPGFELAIREIAQRYGSEDLLDEFMRINRDRVSPAGRKPLL